MPNSSRWTSLLFFPAVDQSHQVFVGSSRANEGMWQVSQATVLSWWLTIFRACGLSPWHPGCGGLLPRDSPGNFQSQPGERHTVRPYVGNGPLLYLQPPAGKRSGLRVNRDGSPGWSVQLPGKEQEQRRTGKKIPVPATGAGTGINEFTV